MTNQATEKQGIPAHLTERSLLQPVIQAWKYYLNDQGRSPYTVKAFVADLNLLDEFLAPDKMIGDISLTDLENFTNWLQNDRGVPCSPKSLSRRITSIKSFFRWLVKGGVLNADPAEKVIQKTVISPLPTVLTPTEHTQALEAANALRTAANPDPRPYTLMLLVLETALKKGECLSLMTNHLEIENPDQAYIHVRYKQARYRYKERKVGVSPDWVAAYHEYAEKYQITDQVFPWSQRRLEYLLEDVTKAANMENIFPLTCCAGRAR